MTLHGYTLTDLHHAALLATRTARTHTGHAGYHEAYSAIALTLCTATTPPTHHDLITAGRTAIHRMVTADLRHAGLPYGDKTGARYATYWTWAARHTDSPEEQIVEALALDQIWPCLTPQEQQALTALAEHGTYQAAADHLGIPYGRLHDRIRRARHRALALWHEHETPARRWWDRRDGGPAAHTGHRVMQRLRQRTATTRRPR